MLGPRAVLENRRYRLPLGYRVRRDPVYFSDVARPSEIWQPGVYQRAAAEAERFGRPTLIDIGCGGAWKLHEIWQQHPTWSFVGVDVGRNIAFCRAEYSFATWVECDVDSDVLELPPEFLTDGVVIAADIIEHLVRPERLLRAIHGCLAAGAHRAIVSTPERDLRSGRTRRGPSPNPTHVREWNTREFARFIRSQGLTIESHELTIDNSTTWRYTTQMAVLSVDASIRPSRSEELRSP